MDETIVLSLAPEEALPAVSALRDPDCALAYAFAFSNGGRASVSELSSTLSFDEKRAKRALDLLVFCTAAQQSGAVPVREKAPPHPREIADARAQDPAFSYLCGYYEKAQERVARKSELETLYSVYTDLSLPADVLMFVINYCKSNGTLSPRSFEKAAYSWHDAGITTYDEAAQYVELQVARKSRPMQILRMFGISGRKPSQTEEKYINEWVKMGLSDELLSLAYDRTVLRTGKLSLSYMNTILVSWYTLGVKTPEQVQELDKGPHDAKVKLQDSRGMNSVISIVSTQFDERRKMHDRELETRLSELRCKSPEFKQTEKALKQLAASQARAAFMGSSGCEDTEREQLLKRQKQILAALGYDEDYLTIPPDCPLCNDLGYIGSRMCSCFEQACEKQRKAQERA